MPKTEPPTDKVLQSQQVASRQGAMWLLARATETEVSAGLAAIGNIDDTVEIDEAVDLRVAETGLVMLRGRIGGDGAPFNIGEATVTRCAIQLRSGKIGLSYSLGRDREKARLAAVCDALWQTEKYRATIERHVLAPVRERIERERDLVARQVAATRVDFFTLVRGEDQA